MDLLDALRTHRLLAIVRTTDPEAALGLVLTLADCGVRLVEVSLTTPSAFDVLRRARAALGDGFGLGAGTVLTAEDARRAADAGAAYLVTPAIAPSLAAATEVGLPVLAGALTPSEVVQAHLAGATAIKLFPASIGGPAYLRALRDPFPTVPFVAVGGVDLAAAKEYLALGAVAVGVGSPLVGDPAQVRSRAAAFLSAVTSP
jgi:2-dehydro-3-deoxyphosphogluconate aldolase / (4S)-4-hydroxy-2-oxoglutarate aldolase